MQRYVETSSLAASLRYESNFVARTTVVAVHHVLNIVKQLTLENFASSLLQIPNVSSVIYIIFDRESIATSGPVY